MVSLFTGLITAAAIATGFYAIFLADEAKSPPMEDGWWGRGPVKPEKDTSIRKFKVKVPNDVITDLKTRLAKTRLGEDLENTQFQYGFQSTYLKEVLEYWQTKYDWRKHEAELNKFQQFKTMIEGIEVHFLRVKPASHGGQNKARPILITHGWPGSVWEFYKLIPRLTDPGKYGGRDEDAFEVICPSIPGYGFSEAPHQQGFDTTDAARVFHKLMGRLGHQKYYVQGGDWGALISTVVAQAYPENVLGLHINLFADLQPKPLAFMFAKRWVVGLCSSLFLDPRDQKVWTSVSSLIGRILMEFGYHHIQSTKPDTPAVGLNDSPAGLAAYILEKFSTWTKLSNTELPDGGLTNKFTLDELLTNVMIYWVQGNIGSSIRFYKENEYAMSESVRDFDVVPVEVPTAIAAFPDEMVPMEEAMIPGKFQNVVQYNRMPRGGHFAAFEEPELLANDIISFARKIEHSK